MTDIQLRKATLEDEEGILDITRLENLWAGMDYLPFALHNWLKEAEEENSDRENYVLVLGEKIVGFRSVHFMRRTLFWFSGPYTEIGHTDFHNNK